MKLLGTLAFVIALLLSVMVHEFGHYLTAKRFGMKVTEFFLGFGKRIWSFTRGETEFGIKAIPAGGYCRIEGMTPRDEMPAGEESRAFYGASTLQKLIVLGAGSFAHFIIGFLLIFSILFGVGVNALLSDITQVSPNSAAAAAGFQPGDKIVEVEGKKVTDWYQDAKVIATSGGRELSFKVERDGQIISLKASPTYLESEKRYLLGVVTKVGTKREGFVTSVKDSVRATGVLTRESAKALVALPTKVPQLIRQTFGDEERDPNGLVGVVGAARVSGEAVGSQKLDSTERFGTFLLLVASLNIFVGLFNLLPLLPLDGGHMAVAIADEIRALFARLRGRPRPAAIDVNALTPLTIGVFAVLAVLTVILLIADIFNPVSLNL
ncbi:peptidase [Candidatus Planktophila sulfonica]|uniref:Peptidase n=1 Tax=Candidatus Planktophila sulfonica TaxID=1884904 RepID=A0A249KH84_9ACTN|nr:M50 family metallopeptidase [Candidatus Planktophila sulfonica]ASY16151.1 peptidase [Candidatus Planktophila sulfonica]